MVTLGGQTHVGQYDRHAFCYTVPKRETLRWYPRVYGAVERGRGSGLAWLKKSFLREAKLEVRWRYNLRTSQQLQLTART